MSKAKCVEEGLEFRNRLTYLNWEPGGEYTQTLVIKNVLLTTQKLKFKLSNSQFSTPVCHQPIVLCAGTSFTLPVTFRPCEMNQCEGSILFEKNDGKKIVMPIKALLPHPELTLTEHLKFGMCAVKSSVSITFEMSNIGNISTFFQWNNPNVFTIHPNSGKLEPNETCRLKATFSPELANVYAEYALCNFSDKVEISSVHCKVVKMEGIGKYPYVVVKNGLNSPLSKTATHQPLASENEFGSNKEIIIDFGRIAVGASVEKWIEVNNPSPVSCDFTVHPYTNVSFKCPFFVLENEKNLQPQSSIKVKIVYLPKLLLEHADIGYFTVQAQGSSGYTRIKCIGRSIGPMVSVTNENGIVSFGNIEVGKISTASISLKNNSHVCAVFQLQINETSVFSCDTVSGIIDPYSNISISAKFTPQRAIPHCRTVTVIVHNQEPLFVQLIGTGFSQIHDRTPYHFGPTDILRYLEHARTGISLLPPERLKELVDKGLLVPDATNNNILKSSQSISSLPHLHEQKHSSNFDKYMVSENEASSILHVSSDITSLEFGYCSHSLSSDGKMITISNHTYGEVTCIWMIDNLRGFDISPSERSILPKKSASFMIHFKPDKPSMNYNAEVECYVFYKELNNYSHVDALTATPPWCVTVYLSGHSFNKDFGTLLSESPFYSEDIVFPPTIMGQLVYRTVVLKNFGKEPTIFKVKEDNDKIFRAKPINGIIRDFQLIVIQMNPREAKTYNHVVKYYLNTTGTVYSKNFNLFGFGEMPKITLENKGQLYFKPTCIGNTSSRTFSFKNSTGIPLRFEWKHSSQSKCKVIDVEPSSGIILPNEIKDQTWFFTPLEEKNYEMKSVLHSTLETKTACSVIKSKEVLETFGTGAVATIKCSPSTYDFGVLIVGTSKYYHLTLFNSGPCDLIYTLNVYNEFGDAVPVDVIELNPMDGVIYARSMLHIKVTVKPRHSKSYHCTLYYELHSPQKDDSYKFDKTTCSLCQILFVGVFPSLKIIDIQGGGLASSVSKATLWKMLSIDKINESLSDAPLTSELRYSIGSRHSLTHTIPMKARTVIDCDFGAGPLNSENCNIHFILKNDGAVTTHWAFLMSSDVWLEPELWADYGQVDEVEKNESYVLKNDLFMISPKRGCLESGSHVSISITYKHSHIGVNKLPILLKINSGREIVLNLAAVTVEKGSPYLHIGNKEHVFDSIPIGINSYPRQVFPLHNGGDTVIGYEIDVGVLDQQTEENYFMPIFECLQPAGFIPPSTTLPLEFVFSPLEAKKYKVDVPIYLSTGETIVVTLTGNGYKFNNEGSLELQQEQIYKHLFDTTICPQDVANFSHENLDFGCVPQFATVSKLVFVQNTSAHTLSFVWEKDFKKVINVDPVEGYIQPGKSTACKVTFCSSSLSCNYNFDQICKVTDESEVASHQAALRKWNEKNEDEKYALLITDSSQQQKKSMARVISNSADLRGKFGTLPPIGEKTQQSYEEWKMSDLSTKSRKRPINKKTVEKGPPIPPAPILLHLHVMANSMSVSDYIKLYWHYDNYWIDYSTLTVKNSTLCCIQQDELDFQKFVLNQVIKEILTESDFIKALERVAREPVPYFSQFATKSDSKPPFKSKVECQEMKNIDSSKQIPIKEPTVELPIDEVLSEYTMEQPCLTSNDYSSIVEDLMQNILLNMFVEANVGEFNVDNPLCVITKSN